MKTGTQCYASTQYTVHSTQFHSGGADENTDTVLCQYTVHTVLCQGVISTHSVGLHSSVSQDLYNLTAFKSTAHIACSFSVQQQRPECSVAEFFC